MYLRGVRQVVHFLFRADNAVTAKALDILADKITQPTGSLFVSANSLPEVERRFLRTTSHFDKKDRDEPLPFLEVTEFCHPWQAER